MSTLRLIARARAAAEQQRQEAAQPADAAAAGLGAALQAEISKAVQAALQDMPRSRPVAVPDHREEMNALRMRLSTLEQQKRQPTQMPEMRFERDGVGQARTMVIGDRRFLIHRDANGRMVSLSPAPELVK